MNTQEQREAQFRHMQQIGVARFKAPQEDDDSGESLAAIAQEPITPVGWIVLAGCALIIVLSLMYG